MVAIIITGIIFILSYLWCTITKKDRCISGFCLSMSAILFFVSIQIYNEKEIPSAIDVYRERTTLQVTYVDSIPTDTVVIFKKF